MEWLRSADFFNDENPLFCYDFRMKTFGKIICSALFFGAASFLPAQEALLSTEEEYFDFLKLNGAVQKESMSYRTLSDSVWTFTDEENPFGKDSAFPWVFESVGGKRTFFDWTKPDENWFLRGISKKFSLKTYGPEFFSSYNSRAPFGQNDGALWQGRGFNASLTSGVRLETFGFELTLKPQITFSQNKEFEIMSQYNKNYSQYAHYGTSGIDAPQRFGDAPFFQFDWGDTEIRWNFWTFTMGFGTQNIWNGPSVENSIMLSNNAPTFPKVDFGLRPTEIIIPYLNWSLGKFETRLFYGRTSESDYFDTNESNDHNMLSGITFGWSPSFAKGLTFSFTKICLSKWGEQTAKYLNPFFSGNTIRNHTGEDQFASLSADWVFPKVGFEIYGEIGVDDFLANGLKLYEYARYPFHATAYTVGLKKSISFSAKKKIHGVLSMEWNHFEPSQDYQLWANSNYNFGSHGQITQGKTNLGQYIGSGLGYGGNSQVMSLKVYSPHGYDKFILGRNNPDNGYIFNKFVNQIPNPSNDPNLGYRHFQAFKANLYIGFESMWFITKKFSVTGGFLYDLIINPRYDPNMDAQTYSEQRTYWNNFRFTLKLKHQI